MFSWRTISFTLVGLATSVPIRADIVFSNVATDCGRCEDAIQGRNNSSLSLAAAFTPGADFILTGAKARFVGLADSTINFAIFSDAGNLPGLQLAGLGSVTVAEGTTGLKSAGGPAPSLALSGGVEYWLVLTPGTDATLVGWQDQASSPQPFAATRHPDGISGWGAVGPQSVQFVIDGAPVATAIPELGSVRRKRNSRQALGDSNRRA